MPLAVALLGPTAALSQQTPPYLLRLAHESQADFACVLLESSGRFHYEEDDYGRSKVFEGELGPAQLEQVRKNVRELWSVTQSQIEEPVIPGGHDLFDVHFAQDGDWRRLLFRSRESQEPFVKALKPLLQWMQGLQKVPHSELSEDQGKKNCLPHRELTLKSRSEVEDSNHGSSKSMKTFGAPLVPAPTLPPHPPPASQPMTALLKLSLLTRETGKAEQKCALVLDDGRYRIERRTQTGSNNKVKIETRIAIGRMTPEESAALTGILNAPPLVKLKHREPAAGRVLRIRRTLLELAILRPAGTQELVLTDNTFNRDFFYVGDGDISHATSLLEFLKRNLQKTEIIADSPEQQNGCKEVPLKFAIR